MGRLIAPTPRVLALRPTRSPQGINAEGQAILSNLAIGVLVIRQAAVHNIAAQAVKLPDAVSNGEPLV
jgi:hypothetical protein